MSFAAVIEGIGVTGPGLVDWSAARALMSGAAAFVPTPTVIASADMLPATERRRAGKCVRLALATAFEAVRHSGRGVRDFVAIFASSSGDGENCHAICETLASGDRLISPTRFHNSVQNAPAGYWGIATGAMLAADCVAGFDVSFGAGLVEALGRVANEPSRPVLLVAHDSPYPEPLHGARPIADSFAVALALSAGGTSNGGALMEVEVVREQPATGLDDGALESVRRTIPAARCLPLLSVLARGAAGEVIVEYVDGLSLRVSVRP